MEDRLQIADAVSRGVAEAAEYSGLREASSSSADEGSYLNDPSEVTTV